MNLQDVITMRQSVRKFTSDPVPKEDLVRMAELAGMAPSGKNCQNWHFVFVCDDEKKNDIADVIQKKATWISENAARVDEEKGARFAKFVKNFTLFFTKAPVLIIVYTTDYFSSGSYELSLFDEGKPLLDMMKRKNPGMQNLGAAIENFTLAAIDLGYGSCWLTSANYAAPEIEELLSSKYGFSKEGYFMGAMLALGKVDGIPKSPKKKPVEEIISFI